MSNYRVIETNQFAYSPVTSRNGEKITVALLKDNEKAILSPAYTVIEVIDENELIPEYLFIWFNRSEFDRYTQNYSSNYYWCSWILLSNMVGIGSNSSISNFFYEFLPPLPYFRY